MRERITANLPARSLDAAEAFYGALGFETAYRDEGWLILRRGPLELEIFPYPDLDPAGSVASCCVRVADADRLYEEWSAAGLSKTGIPRMTAPEDQPFGWRMFALVDLNGNLLRVLSPIGLAA